MKIIPPLLLGLLLIAPELQASETAPGSFKFLTEEEAKKRYADEIAQALAQAKDQNDYINILIRAVCTNDIPLTKTALTHVDMERFPQDKDHPLFSTSKPEMLQLLINHKSDVNTRSFYFNSTVLMDRCDSQFLDDDRYQCVKILLDQPKIDVNAQNCYGCTALHELIRPYRSSEYREKHFPLAQKLLTCGADPYIEDNSGIAIAEYLAGAFPKAKEDLYKRTLALCVAQRPHRIQCLHDALAPHLTKDTAGIVIGYLPEGFQEAQARKTKTDSTTPTKTSKDGESS